MKKKIYPILLIILLTFLKGCVGYEPIFSSTNLQFNISDYSIEGDKVLGNKIYSRLHNLSKSKKDNHDIKSLSFIINVSKNKNATSKDSAGKILEYKIILNTKIEATDIINNNKILDQNFVSSTSYKVQDLYTETKKLEDKSVETLINKIYQDLLIELSEKIITQ